AISALRLKEVINDNSIQYVEYLGARPDIPNYRDLAAKHNLNIVGLFMYNSESNYTKYGVPYLLVSSSSCPEGKVCPVVYLLKLKRPSLYSFLLYSTEKNEFHALPFFMKSFSKIVSSKNRNYLYFYGDNMYFVQHIHMDWPETMKICRTHYSRCKNKIQLDIKVPETTEMLGKLKIIRVAFDHYILSVFVGPNFKEELVCPLPFHYGSYQGVPIFYTPFHGKVY
ncbi:hypothetical protein HMI56_006867, partial [Coelomomyces lativittatus]